MHIDSLSFSKQNESKLVGMIQRKMQRMTNEDRWRAIGMFQGGTSPRHVSFITILISEFVVLVFFTSNSPSFISVFDDPSFKGH